MSSCPDPFVVNPGIDFTRHRICTFENTILTLLTMESHSLNRELFEFYRFHNKPIPTKSAFVQAKGKLTIQSLAHLFHRFNQSIPFQKSFRGMHLIGCDGTDSNIPACAGDDSSFIPLRCGYYQNHITVLYDLLEKRYLDWVVQPRREADEHDACVQMVNRNSLNGSCLFIADRGFCSYNLLAHIIEKGQFFLIRSKDICSLNSPFYHTFVPNDDEFDIPVKFILTRNSKLQNRNNEHANHNYAVKYLRPSRKFDFIQIGDFSSQYALSLRLVKVKLSEDNFEYLITNLPVKKCSVSDLKELYHLRWKIETSFLFLKYGIGMNYFHSVRRDFIELEIVSRLIMSNYISLMISCALPAQRNSITIYTISVSDAIYKCRLFLLQPMPNRHFLQLLSRDTVPIRAGRSFNRKVRSQILKSFQNRT